MAKNHLPSFDGAKSAVNSIRADIALIEDVAKATTAIHAAVVETKTAPPAVQPAFTIDSPVSYSEGYVSRRVDIKLSREAAIKLRDKLRHLQDIGAKTSDGRFVTNKTQAIQWIFEHEVK